MSAKVDVGLGIPSLSQIWNLSKSVVRRAVWAPDPIDQVVTNLIIVAALMLSSAVGFVVGIPLAIVSLGLLAVGLVRLLVRAVM